MKRKKDKFCVSCGGRLEQKNEYTYQCIQCSQEYYFSEDKKNKINIHIKLSSIIITVVISLIALMAGGIWVYQMYTTDLVQQSKRFCAPFRDFLMEAYNGQILTVDDEKLNEMKYLKIERDEGNYIFTYSFEDYYDYTDRNAYETTLKSVAVEGKIRDFSPTNVQYFSGLTRLELYTGAWQNYKLPNENKLRCIYCKNGYSRYGTASFFENVNPETLEEVFIYDAEELTDFSFLEQLQGIKYFGLEGATLKNAEVFEYFDKFDKLEHLSLNYVEMSEEDAYEIINTLLSLPSLNSLYLEGRCSWYITEEQWSHLQQQYGEKITIRRE